nr:hypothetical protein [Mesorhizobium loti]
MKRQSAKPTAASDQPLPMPHWVKRSCYVAAALILLVIAAMAVVGGEHGPGRHFASGSVSGQQK